MSDRVHVVAGVLRDAQARVLLAQRPQGKDHAGLWEFPGGKCEPGEEPRDALRRELREELAIDAGAIEPLIAIPWRYAEKYIFLDVYNVNGYTGLPRGHEGQVLRWIPMQQLPFVAMPAADRPVATALRLPRRYAITPEPANDSDFLTSAQTLLHTGSITLLQLRSKRSEIAVLRSVAGAMRDLARASGAGLMLNDHADLVEELALDGVHLSAARLMECRIRPLPADKWVAASCHDADELAHAAQIGVDFAVLGPVNATASHAHAAVLGWSRFAELCAQAPFPVYALGGLREADLPAAIAAGAQGIAGISGFWPAGVG